METFKKITWVEFVVNMDDYQRRARVCLKSGKITISTEYINGGKVCKFIAIVEKSERNLKELFEAGCNFFGSWLNCDFDAVRVEIPFNAVTSIEFAKEQ